MTLNEIMDAKEQNESLIMEWRGINAAMNLLRKSFAENEKTQNTDERAFGKATIEAVYEKLTKREHEVANTLHATRIK